MDHKAVYDLTYALGVQLRFSGMLTRILVERDILTLTQARLLIQDVASHLPEGNPHKQLYDELILEFQK